MKILHQYGLKSLTHNYKRTIAIIVGITLSMAMMISIATLTFSARDALQTKQKEVFGDYHSLFYHVANNQKDFVLHNASLSQVMQVQSLGIDYLTGSKNDLKPYINVMGFQQASLDHLQVELKEGHFPKNEHEIILAQHIIYNGKVNIKIGDQLHLNLGKRVNKDSLETIRNMDAYFENSETIIDTIEHDYKVVGFFKRPSFEDFSSASYSAITAFNPNLKIPSDIYVKYDNPSNAIKNTLAIANVIKSDSTQYDFNYNLLIYYNALPNSRSSFLINIVSGFTMLVVLLGSATLLYNSFSMSMRKERQHLAMLQSVGATTSQIKGMLLFQGLIISLISIPLGILIGLLSVFASLGIFNQLILSSSFEMSTMEMKIVWPIIILCALLVFTLIEFCIWLPSKSISKSLIDDMKIKGNEKAKKYRMDKKHGSIINKLALKHFKFQKHRHRNILISLITLMVLFVSFHSLMNNVQKVRDEAFLDSKYDVSMNYSVKSGKDFIANEIEHLQTRNTYIMTSSQQEVEIPIKYLNKIFQNKLNREQRLVNQKNVVTNLIGIEDKQFKEIFSSSADKEIRTAYLYNQFIYSKNHSKEYINQEVTLPVIYGKSVDFKVIPTNIDFGFLSNPTNPTLIVSISQLNHLFQNEFKQNEIDQDYLNYTVYFHTNESNALETELKNIQGLNNILGYDIYNYDRINNESRSIKLLTNLLFIGFISLVFIVGFVNILNTAHSEYQMRRQELAMLNSIGMRKKDIFKMLLVENAIDAILALIIAFIINYMIAHGLSYFFQKAGIGYDTAIPYVDYLYCILIGCFSTCLVLGYHILQRRKESLADIIKEQSI
ncbi:MAG: FtsX-like permease family protein [Erysipelotrichaceae bacterium]